MATSHDSNVTVAVSLDSAPAAGPEFQIPLLAVPLAANSLNGDRVRAYAEPEDVTDDETAGYISATTAAQLKSGLSQGQRPRPPIVKVAYVDLAAPETYAESIAEILNYDPGWYGLAIQDHSAAATHVLVSDEIESGGERIFCFQSSDADWKNAGIPAGYTGLQANERTLGVYHDDAAAAMDFATLCAGLQDPDSFSSPWTMNVGGVDPYTTALTTGERLQVVGNNLNAMGEFGSSTTWLDPGTNIVGRTMRAIIMRDWLRARLRERTYSYIQNKSNALEPVEVTPAGQNEVGSILEQLIGEGQDIGHFAGGELTYPDITATDLSLRRVRVQGNVKYIVDGRLASFNVFLEAGV